MNIALVSNLKRTLLVGALTGLMAGSTVSLATPVNPDPALFAEDTGAEVFSPSPVGLVLEIFDLGAGDGGEFGFYFIDAPGTLVRLFGADDISGLAGSGPVTEQLAAVDFINGFVQDVDAQVEESMFTPASVPIGFYFRLATSGTPLYSQALLNASGVDVAGLFPILADPGAIIAFEDPASGTLISLHAILGITTVPEPSSTLLLLAVALLVAWRFSRHGGRARLTTGKLPLAVP